MDFIKEYWSQIFALVAILVAAVKLNSLVQILRRDVDTLDKDIKRRDTYVETVKLRAEVDQLNKNISALWEHLNKLKDRSNG
jgi:polyhydroxyalkanoate synthesis regulator phasin|tara:strand:- start:588 stop:833 length:246 start_codon:yes stop_codon:yes gene_type:complete